jgi:DNA-binding SARP family transcriptional activator
MFEVTMFGTTSVNTGNGRAAVGLGGVKPRQILEIMALANGAPVSKERLADLLWEGDPPKSYLATLESYICVLRRQLGSRGRTSVIMTTSKGYALDPAQVRVDLAWCRSLLESAMTASDAASGIALTEQALEVSRQPLLASEPYADWAAREREHLVRELVEGCVRASAQSLTLGDGARAVRLARSAVQLDGFAEDAWRQMMRALVSTGRRGEALQAFNHLRTLMAGELGVEPAGATQELYLQVLRDESGPLRESGPDSGELRTLLALLRRALDSTPGITVPRGDSGLSFAAVQALAVA